MASTRTGRRMLAWSGSIGALLVAAALLAMAGPWHHAALPSAVLTAGSDFGLSGSVAGLAPGVAGSLLMTATNPFAEPITITQLTIAVPAPPASCPLADVTVGGQSFAGSPPVLTVGGLAQLVPADSTATFPVGIMLARSAPNACQDTTLPFSFTGIATGAQASPSPSPGRSHYPPGGPGGGLVTLLSTDHDPSLFGHRVTLTATVLEPDGRAHGFAGGNSARGSVTFFACTRPARLPAASPAGECAAAAALSRPVPVDGSGRARLRIASLPGGHYPVFAVFAAAGGGSGPSYSGTVTQVVGYSRPCVTSWHGEYLVLRGQSVCVSGRVSGSIVVEPGGALAGLGAAIGGRVTASRADAIRLCGSTAGRAVTITAARGDVVAGSRGPFPCAGNTLRSGLTLRANEAGFDVTGNRIGGAVVLISNTGTGPFWQQPAALLSGNVIARDLICRGNRPAPSGHGRGNAVGGRRRGQCAVTGAS